MPEALPLETIDARAGIASMEPPSLDRVGSWRVDSIPLGEGSFWTMHEHFLAGTSITVIFKYDGVSYVGPAFVNRLGRLPEVDSDPVPRCDVIGTGAPIQL